jgi:hypothetical protein
VSTDLLTRPLLGDTDGIETRLYVAAGNVRVFRLAGDIVMILGDFLRWFGQTDPPHTGDLRPISSDGKQEVSTWLRDHPTHRQVDDQWLPVAGFDQAAWTQELRALIDRLTS